MKASDASMQRHRLTAQVKPALHDALSRSTSRADNALAPNVQSSFRSPPTASPANCSRELLHVRRERENG